LQGKKPQRGNNSAFVGHGIEVGLYGLLSLEAKLAIEAKKGRLGLNFPLMAHLKLGEPRDYCVLAHLSLP